MSDIQLVRRIIFHSLDCFFAMMNVSFVAQKILMSQDPICQFSRCFLSFCSPFQKDCGYTYVLKYFSSFKVSGLILKSLTYFELIFVQGDLRRYNKCF